MTWLQTLISTRPLRRSGQPISTGTGEPPRPTAGGREGGRASWARRAGIVVAFGAVCGPALAQADALGSDVQGLLAHARAQSPEIAAMRLEADAAAERVGPAGALPDPVLRVELMNINNYGMDGSGSTSLLPSKVGETRYTLMQMLPLWGKRGLKRDVAAAGAQQARAQTEAAWVELAAMIKATYAEYYRAAGNERLATEILGLMTRLEQIAQSRYAGGLVGQSDAIRAQLEQTAMRTELIALESEKRQLRAKLNGLLARHGNEPLAEPQALRPLPPLGTADTLALGQRARDRNPQILAETAKLDAAQKTRELTLRERYPDLQVGLVPSQMGNRITTWGVMFEINVPLQQERRRGMERESEAMVGAARSRIDALSHQLLGQLAGNLSSLEAARRTSALINTQLLPQSELGLQSALAGYENGKAEFSMLLEAQRAIRKARQELLKSEVEAQLRLAEIERLVGEEL